MKLIKNTFAPHIKNEYFRETDIMYGLKQGTFDYDKLPDEVKKKLEKFATRRRSDPYDPFSP